MFGSKKYIQWISEEKENKTNNKEMDTILQVDNTGYFIQDLYIYIRKPIITFKYASLYYNSLGEIELVSIGDYIIKLDTLLDIYDHTYYHELEIIILDLINDSKILLLETDNNIMLLALFISININELSKCNSVLLDELILLNNNIKQYTSVCNIPFLSWWSIGNKNIHNTLNIYYKMQNLLNRAPCYLSLINWTMLLNIPNIICIGNYTKFDDSSLCDTTKFELFYSLYCIHKFLNISNLVYNLVIKKNNMFIDKPGSNVYITSSRGERDTFVFPFCSVTYCFQIIDYTDGLDYTPFDFNKLSNTLNITCTSYNNLLTIYKRYLYKEPVTVANIYDIN
jgi:hypothetical protein